MLLDRKDWVVIQELDKNARASLGELGRKLRLSKAAVGRRIERLEREGVITGYYAVVDASRVGYTSIGVYLKLSRTDPQTEQSIVDALAREKRVWWLGKQQEPWDIGFAMWGKELTELDEFWRAFKNKFGRYILRFQIVPIVRLLYFHPDFVNKKMAVGKRRFELVGEGGHVEIDRVDRKILSVITSNARMPTVGIAKLAGVTPGIVKYRVAQLIRKRVLKGFRAAINFSKLGYTQFKITFTLDDYSKLGALRRFVESAPTLAYINEMMVTDLDAEFYLKDVNELENLLSSIKERFGAAVREYDYLTYTKVFKYSRFPEE